MRQKTANAISYIRGNPSKKGICVKTKKVFGEKFTFLTHTSDQYTGAYLRSQKPLPEQDKCELIHLLSKAKSCRSILDIGANIGFYATLMSRHLPDATIVSIEPEPQNYAALITNLQLNNCQNVKPFNLALGSKWGLLESFRNEQNPGDSTSFEPDKQYQERSGHTLTKVLATVANTSDFVYSLKDKLPHFEPDFIKIDTQGFDVLILSELLPAIKRNTMISMELSPHHLKMSETTIDQTLGCLEDMSHIEKLSVIDGKPVVDEISMNTIANYLHEYPDHYAGYMDLFASY